MGLISKHGTTFVVLINTIFGMIGLFFLLAGGLVKFAPEYVDKYGGKLIETMKDQMPQEISKHVEDFKLSEFVGEAATGFLIIGGVLIAIVMWAYFGTCCHSRWMLLVYTALLTIIILAEVAVAVLFTTNRTIIDDKLKKPLQESLRDYYEGSTSNSAISLGWNALMGLLHCCGVDGPDDFKTVNSWNKTGEMTGGTPASAIANIEAPMICLKDKESGINTLVTAITIPDDLYIQTGCYDAIWNIIADNQAIAIGVLAAVGALQVILWILTVCIVHGMAGKDKNKVGPS